MRSYDRRTQTMLRRPVELWCSALTLCGAGARQALRSLIPEPLHSPPKTRDGKRFYIFEGTAVLDRPGTLPKAWWPQGELTG